jgi:hypothetical protein
VVAHVILGGFESLAAHAGAGVHLVRCERWGVAVDHAFRVREELLTDVRIKL